MYEGSLKIKGSGGRYVPTSTGGTWATPRRKTVICREKELSNQEVAIMKDQPSGQAEEIAIAQGGAEPFVSCFFPPTHLEDSQS